MKLFFRLIGLVGTILMASIGIYNQDWYILIGIFFGFWLALIGRVKNSRFF